MRQPDFPQETMAVLLTAKRPVTVLLVKLPGKKIRYEVRGWR